jgi:hypothetical protein
MALMNFIRHISISWSTTNNLAICSRQAKVKLRGSCWVFKIKSIHQLRHKKEEKLTILNTYAFTIDQVPHVFGDDCFAGHKYKYMGKATPKGAFWRWIVQRINRKAHQLKSSRQNTTQGAAQEHSPTHHAKAVVRGLGRGRPHPMWSLSTTPSDGSCMKPCRGSGDSDSTPHHRYPLHHFTPCINRG